MTLHVPRLKEMRAPNGETCVQPATIFFPAAGGHGVDAHENVRLAELDRFPAIDERISRGALGKMHGDRIHLGFFRVVS